MIIDRQIIWARLTSVFIIGAISAAAWDIWWHRAVGRDTLWGIPHLFLYGFATATIFIAFYVWYKTQSKRWKLIAIFLTLILLSAPFDQFWHLLFGVEDLSRPISLAWSPPHIMIVLAVIGSLIALLSILRQDKNKNTARFFGVLVFATIFASVMFLLLPFHPTEGWGQVIGFYGAGVLTLTSIGIPLLAREWIDGKAIATRTMILATLIQMIMRGEETAPQVVLQPHDQAPNWLIIFSVIPAAIWLDLSHKFPFWIRGAVAGAIWSIILFTFSNMFFESAFQYSITNTLIAIVSSIIGGGIAGFIVWFLHKKKIFKQ